MGGSCEKRLEVGAQLPPDAPPYGVARDARGSSSTELRLPERDEPDPEISIVVPAANEGVTITDFVAWCQEGLAKADVRGEILIVDSSTDDTPVLALQAGARVLHTPKRGLGRAYIDALPFIRGKYVVMGDADCTYDFRDVGLFVEKFRDGYQFVMGSRWKGHIEQGSMPFLHRHLGTPVTTWILNRLYSSRFSDIHCGMRGITREALLDMGLTSQSWEYASEMVLKSVRMKLTTTEVPVSFYKDRPGRVSHHRREGWFSPFHAAWINLRAMFVYGADYFVIKPGIVMVVLGLLLTARLTAGDFAIGNVHFSLYWMLLGVTVTLLGMQSIYFGCIAQVLCDFDGEARRKWLRIFPYTRTVLLSALAFVVGVFLACGLIVQYSRHGLRLPLAGGGIVWYHLAVTGLMLIIAGFLTFVFTLVLHATGIRYGRALARAPSPGSGER
jgi:glycosyltransferase involved in cell wall biosynthesis